MADPIIGIEGDSFIDVAMRHGLLQEQQANKILEHASQNGVRPSDAALTLSMLQLHEVDAVRLLGRPRDLSPGYELISLIGCGAGGMVFRARQIALGRDVAIKTINQNARNAKTTGESRIQREAHAIAQLQHPGIVAAIDSGFHQDRFCIAMELVEGETLVDFILRESPVSELVAWQIARQVACALSHANASGIIHRDIKPANLLLCQPPTGHSLPPDVPFVKVADFGLAFHTSDQDISQLTQVGTTLGTPAYVAPEQLLDTHVDARADIYSLGATVFHILTGQAPCADQSPMRTIMQKTIGEDSWRQKIQNDYCDATVALFRDMTESDVDQRITDYDTLIRRIDELADPSAVFTDAGSQSVSAKSEMQGSAGRRLNTKTMLATAAAIVLITMLTVGALYLTGRSGNESRNEGVQSGVAEGNAVEWVADGFPQPLFNGKSVPLFRQFGSWTPGATDDGSRVLIGQAGSEMTIPLTLRRANTGNLRLRLGLAIDSDSTTEIGIRCGQSKSDDALLRFRDGMFEFVVVSVTDQADEVKSLTSRQSTFENTVFQRITLVRRDDQLKAIVNGEIVGVLPCQSGAPATIHLRSVLGTAQFADMDVVALKPAAKTGPVIFSGPRS